MKNKNTYSMIAQSEEKGRTIFESTLYALFVVATLFCGWQFATNSLALPSTTTAGDAPAAIVAKATPEQPLVADRG